MTRDKRYDILFEPLKIGPVTTKNRFYQVPHCSGMGYSRPNTINAAREMNAEGGWGVVCTEYCSIHPSANEDPYPQCTLWDEGDVSTLADMTERVHRHGALAGVELWYGGYATDNKLTHEYSLAPSSNPSWDGPGQTQAMDKTDIRNLRQWHRDAALRAKRAGFDIVYVYAGHGYLPAQFLSPVENQRSDEYGGSFENRARLLKELLEDTKEAVGDTCAVALRFGVHNLDREVGISHDGEGRALVEYLAELPDLWDVNVADYAADSRSSRFVAEGAQEEFVSFVKQVTSKPVVGVGRFTSPDTMASQLRRGVLDLIGAARPSIADPFIPAKIERGDNNDIRECIGCNICIWSNGHAVPIRCTQNPTRGEEWRRGWHPEKIAPAHADESILIVGGGPAGLEAARALGHRGYRVTLAEAGTELGGRVNRESSLPGLSEWIRVRDYRVQQIQKMPNVEVYLDSELDAQQVLDFGFQHVCIATGARWREDGRGRHRFAPIDGYPHTRITGPDQIMAGVETEGPVVVYDDEHFYMGGLIAEKLRLAGHEVLLVTSAACLSPMTEASLEQGRIQSRALELGIELLVSHEVTGFDGQNVTIACTYSGKTQTRACNTLVPVTSREPTEQLYLQLSSGGDALTGAGILSLERIGDCAAPGIIAQATHAGHRYAQMLGDKSITAERDRVVIGRG